MRRESRVIEVRIDRRGRGDHAVWRLWWRDGAGRKRTRERRSWTRAEAEAEAARTRADLNDRSRATPWDEFVCRYLAYQRGRNRPTTVADVRCVLARLAAVMAPATLADLTAERAAAYLDGGLGQGVVPDGRARALRPLRAATWNKHLRTLRTAMRWAVRAGMRLAAGGGAAANPFDGIRRRREVHIPQVIYGRRGQHLMLANAAASDGPRWEAAVLLGLECGLRVGEISHLTWGSVDEGSGEVVVGPEPDGWSPKGTCGRASLTARLTGVLQTLRAEAEGGLGGRVVGGASPRAFEREFRRRLAEACRRAGLPAIKPHGLRRSYGTLLANDGMESLQLATVMRHRDLATTRLYYAAIREREAAEAARKTVEGGR